MVQSQVKPTSNLVLTRLRSSMKRRGRLMLLFWSLIQISKDFSFLVSSNSSMVTSITRTRSSRCAMILSTVGSWVRTNCSTFIRRTCHFVKVWWLLLTRFPFANSGTGWPSLRKTLSLRSVALSCASCLSCTRGGSTSTKTRQEGTWWLPCSLTLRVAPSTTQAHANVSLGPLMPSYTVINSLSEK